MPVSQQYFVLFQSEGLVKATLIASFPSHLSFEGKVYELSKRSLIDFNHLVLEGRMVGFDFLNAEDGGQEFLSSGFIRNSANVSLRDRTLAIYLRSGEEAESDQGSFMGAHLFQTPEHDYMIVLPHLPQYWTELGFELITRGDPIPTKGD